MKKEYVKIVVPTVYEAEVSYSCDMMRVERTEPAPLSEKEVIKQHNEYFKKHGSNEKTGLPKAWKNESEERKASFLAAGKARRIKVGYDEIPVHRPNGYYIKGNGWVKLVPLGKAELK